jgi:hypothetical protein
MGKILLASINADPDRSGEGAFRSSDLSQQFARSGTSISLGGKLRPDAAIYRRRISNFASCANMHGVGRLPVTGGLLLGDEAEEALDSNDVFPITKDQRNTALAWQLAEPSYRFWIAAGGRHNFGLPVE